MLPLRNNVPTGNILSSHYSIMIMVHMHLLIKKICYATNKGSFIAYCKLQVYFKKSLNRVGLGIFN